MLNKDKEYSVELERARGVIIQLEGKVNLWEKERGKEAKLRKEEQGRLLELIEQKQKFETENSHLRRYLESEGKKVEALKEEVRRMKEEIGEHKQAGKQISEELNEQKEIVDSINYAKRIQ